MLHAAETRGDLVVHTRMLTDTDLFAADAKYHRKCYAAYISDRNIKAAQKKSSCTDESAHDRAFGTVTDIINKTILSKQMDVSQLSELRRSFIKELVLCDSSYSSWKLKKRLKSYYGDQIAFVERPGKSDLVCASTLPVGVVLQRATSLGEEEVEYSDLSSSSSPTLDENQVLHMAAMILRHSIADIKNEDTYLSSLHINIEHCGNFIPNR